MQRKSLVVVFNRIHGQYWTQIKDPLVGVVLQDS